MKDVQWIGKTDTPRLEWGPNGEGGSEAHEAAIKCTETEKKSVLFRGEFAVYGILRSATVSVCGLGFYRLYLNGEQVGNDVLMPLETAYRKRVLYDEYDVTALLREGINAIGAELGECTLFDTEKVLGLACCMVR